MKKAAGLLFSFFFFSLFIYAQTKTDTVVHRIILLGDGGELKKDGTHPVTDSVRKLIPLNANTTILILGDNIYKKGLPDTSAKNYRESKNIINAQLAVADKSDAKVYIIPGNHDWDAGKKDGWEAIKRQQAYVDTFPGSNAEFFPKGGCPGPVEINPGDDITLILFDSQWWLHKHDKPCPGSACAATTKDQLIKQIGDIAKRDTNKLLIIASHHPFRSKGQHGGYYTLKQHIFPLTDTKKWLFIPLPVLGSVYALIRPLVTSQDLKNKNYREMISRVEEAVRPHPHVIFVGGHEHGLQLIKDNNNASFNYIVSGGASKANPINRKKTEFGASACGFAVLEISGNKKVSVKFYTVKKTMEITEEPLLNYISPDR